MPFSNDYKDIYDLGIKEACTDAGAYCERVDEQNYDGTILERIYNQIAKADLIVADMTERNANVFYETGYAHALNKRVVLLTQNAEDIPFDLKQHPHIVYSGGGKIGLLKSDLEKRIRWAIENPQSSLTAADVELQFLVNGRVIENHPIIEISLIEREITKGHYVYEIDLTVDVQNLTNRILNPDYFGLSFIFLAKPFQLSDPENLFSPGTKLMDGQHIYNLEPISRFFPQSWYTMKFSLRAIGKPIEHPELTIPMTIRTFTDLGPKDYEFDIHLKILKK